MSKKNNKSGTVNTKYTVGVITDHLKAANQHFLEAMRTLEELASATVKKYDEVLNEARRNLNDTEAVKRAGKANKKPTVQPKKDVGKKAPAKKAEKPAEEPKQTVKHRTPASARLTPHEITLNLGSFAVKELAERDASELLSHPKVFWNRATVFPNPTTHKVAPRIEGARVIKRSSPQFNGAPYTVSATIHIDGDDVHADAWGVGVFNRNKGEQE